MIIAMVQAGSLAVQYFGDFREGFSQLIDGCGLDLRAGTLLQAVLDKMFELPIVKLEVETLLEGDTRLVSSFATANLQV